VVGMVRLCHHIGCDSSDVSFRHLAENSSSMNTPRLLLMEPMLFLHALSQSNPIYAADTCEEMIEGEPGPLNPFFGNLLYNLRQADPKRALVSLRGR
jgi:hypothetical protein